MSARFESPTMAFRYRLLDLRELPGERFLASEQVEDQILSLLMRLKNRSAAITRILHSIAELQVREREQALGQLMVLCGLRGIESEVEREVKKVPILTSLLDHKVLGREYKKGFAEGEAQGEAKGEARGEARLIRRLLEQKFKRIPKYVDNRLEDATAEQIEVWGERLLVGQGAGNEGGDGR